MNKNKNKPKTRNKKLAGMYGNPNMITRGDIITAAKKKKNGTRKKSTLA